MRSAAAVSLVLAGCYAGSYSTLTSRFIGQRVAVGCLDVALALTQDDVAPSPIIAYTFGNRCAHQTIVDFTAIRVFAVQADGSRAELAVEDPRHELRPMQLDAWTAGDERIAYEAAGGPRPTAICIDLGRFDANAPPAATGTCLAAEVAP